MSGFGLDLIFGLAQVLLLYQQNQIFKQKNAIFARQQSGGEAVESPSRLVRYWPMLAMVVLVALAWIPRFFPGHEVSNSPAVGVPQTIGEIGAGEKSQRELARPQLSAVEAWPNLVTFVRWLQTYSHPCLFKVSSGADNVELRNILAKVIRDGGDCELMAVSENAGSLPSGVTVQASRGRSKEFAEKLAAIGLKVTSDSGLHEPPNTFEIEIGPGSPWQ